MLSSMKIPKPLLLFELLNYCAIESSNIFCYFLFICTRYILAKWLKVVEAIIVAIMSAVIGFLLIFLADDCVPTPNLEGTHHPAYLQVNQLVMSNAIHVKFYNTV